MSHDVSLLVIEGVVDIQALLLHVKGPSDLCIPSTDVSELFVLLGPGFLIELDMVNCLAALLCLPALNSQELRELDSLI